MFIYLYTHISQNRYGALCRKFFQKLRLSSVSIFFLFVSKISAKIRLFVFNGVCCNNKLVFLKLAKFLLKIHAHQKTMKKAARAKIIAKSDLVDHRLKLLEIL